MYVLAGTNGAGKSSIGGAIFREKGADYFNPDEAALRILSANPAHTQEEANSAAWKAGKRLLERAIRERCDFAFETTLGGRTIAALLHRALAAGIEVRIWYVGLESPELHIARVRARVRRGGHDIPEGKIRERYLGSFSNLIQLLPKLTELRVYDNSEDGDPQSGATPKPKLVLHMVRGKAVATCDLKRVPAWAKAILMAALKCSA
jgi:predicted ABC-type ATPase